MSLPNIAYDVHEMMTLGKLDHVLGDAKICIY